MSSQVLGVPRLQLPGLPARPLAQAGELIMQPAPGAGRELLIPMASAGFVAGKPWMVVRDGKAPRSIGQAVEQVGPPQRAVCGDQLRR